MHGVSGIPYSMTLIRIYLILCVVPGLKGVAGVFQTPGLPEDDILKNGDILLGIFEHLVYSDKGVPCGGTDRNNFVVQAVQAADYLIGKINRDNILLPNISLGYVVLNECFHPTVTQYRMTKLLPVDKCAEKCCSQAETNQEEVSNGRSKTTEARLSHRGCYPVVAFVAPISSGMCMAISGLASLYELPHISYMATHQDLSDKTKYRYFSRIVPPDQFQAQAIIDIVRHFNWSYISTVGSSSGYSRNGMEHIDMLTREHGICVAYSAEIRPEFKEEDYDRIVRNLRKNYKAKAVIVFMEDLKHILYAVERGKASGEFIFIASDGPDLFTKEQNPKIQGVNGLKLFFSEDGRHHYEEFETYYKGLSPWIDYKKNPWLGEITETDVQCSWSVEDTNTTSCTKYKTGVDNPKMLIVDYYVRMLDVVMVIARALHNLIKDTCPAASIFKDHLKTCIQGPLLLDYIRNVSFLGFSGKVGFDANGDGLSGYDIKQWQHVSGDRFGYKKVGTWDRETGALSLQTNIEWSKIMNQEDVVNVVPEGLPESVCAKPCLVGEQYIQGELKCCWECRRCRSNERVREDSTGCVLCPSLTWPDQVNFTSCKPIPATFLRWLDPIALGLLGMAGFGVLCMLLIATVFIKRRSMKVIKGSSLELMMTILVAVLMGFACVFILVSRPENITCHVNYYLFHISCSLIFLPLLFKTNRLYHIFRAAEKCQQVVRMVTTRALLGLCVIFGFIEVGLATVATVLFPMSASLQMPVRTEPYVELVCGMSLENLLIPLSYNMAVLLLCAVFGFLTRQLPDNFNESWYIFISVTTTLFVWVAFLPTYFMAFYAYHQTALLALALILNCAVTILCLFAPKVYAVYFVDENNIKVTNFEGPSVAGHTMDAHLEK